MLLACDPRQTTDVTLKTCEDMPENSRPTFVYRYVTTSEWFERKRLFIEHDKATDDIEISEKLNQALNVGLVGWRNVTTPTGDPIPFDGNAAKLNDAMGYTERLALYQAATDAVALGPAAKKNFALPPASAPASSAPNVPPPAGA